MEFIFNELLCLIYFEDFLDEYVNEKNELRERGGLF